MRVFKLAAHHLVEAWRVIVELQAIIVHLLSKQGLPANRLTTGGVTADWGSLRRVKDILLTCSIAIFAAWGVWLALLTILDLEVDGWAELLGKYSSSIIRVAVFYPDIPEGASYCDIPEAHWFLTLHIQWLGARYRIMQRRLTVTLVHCGLSIGKHRDLWGFSFEVRKL